MVRAFTLEPRRHGVILAAIFHALAVHPTDIDARKAVTLDRQLHLMRKVAIDLTKLVCAETVGHRYRR
jgi:hypothetical protein